MTQNIEQRTEVAVTKYEGAATSVDEIAHTDKEVDTPVGKRNSFPKISREWNDESQRLQTEWKNDSGVIREDWKNERNELSTKALGVKVWEDGQLETNVNQQRRWTDNHTYLPKHVPLEMTAVGPNDDWIPYTADKSDILTDVFGRKPIDISAGSIITPTAKGVYPKLNALGKVWELADGTSELTVKSFSESADGYLIIVLNDDSQVVADNVIGSTYAHTSKQSGYAVDQATGYRVYPGNVDDVVSTTKNSTIPEKANAVRLIDPSGKVSIYSLSPVVTGTIESIDENTETMIVSGVKVYLSNVTPTVFNGNALAFGVKPGVVNADRLQAFFDQCELKGWIPYFPDGEYTVLGNFTLPQYGMKGQSRLSTKFKVDDAATGVIFTYNYVGGWNTGQGQLDNFSMGATRECTASLFRVSTPSRGFIFNNVGLNVGSGDAVQLFDSYYINFTNVAFSGAWVGHKPLDESERIQGCGVQVLDREINNIYWLKCDFKDLGSCVKGSGDVFKGSNSLQFTSCAFERIGNVCFNANGFHAQFDSCYFEKLDQNEHINQDKTEGEYLTAIAQAGAGDLIFNNCLMNGGDVRTNDPDYAFFTSVLNRIVFNSGAFAKPAGYQGKILRDVNYSSRAVIVNNSCRNLTDINRPAYERPNQEHTKVYVNVNDKTQIAAGPMMADDTFASTTYRYKTHPSGVMYAFNNPVPFGIVDGSVLNQYSVIKLKATQYRLNTTAKTIGVMDVDMTCTIPPTCPDQLSIDSVTVKYSGDTSVFEESESTLAAKLKVYRITPARTDNTVGYAFAYQIAIVGELGNGVPKKLTSQVEISCTVVDFDGDVKDMKFGIYQQTSSWTSYLP